MSRAGNPYDNAKCENLIKTLKQEDIHSRKYRYRADLEAHIGEFLDPGHVKSRGKMLAPSTRAGRIAALRIFFRDLREWELIPRRFDPMRHLTA